MSEATQSPSTIIRCIFYSVSELLVLGHENYFHCTYPMLQLHPLQNIRKHVLRTWSVPCLRLRLFSFWMTAATAVTWLACQETGGSWHHLLLQRWVQRKAHLQLPGRRERSGDRTKEIPTSCRQGAKSNTFFTYQLINLSGARLRLYITNHLLTLCLCHYCLLHPRLSRHTTHQSQSVALTRSLMIKAFLTITG